MSADLAFFAWHVPQDGFRWLTTREARPNSSEARFLTDATPFGTQFPKERYRWYYPLLETGLFRQFADMEPGEEGIIEFANRYGLLGGGASLSIPVAPADKPGTFLLGNGEPLSVWLEESHDLQEVLTVWDAARRSDLELLRDRIEWPSEHLVRHRGLRLPGTPSKLERGTETIATPDINPEIFSKFQKGDLVMPALYFVQRVVNKKLREHVVSARLLWDSRDQRLSLHVIPPSLNGCIWLQMARAVDGDRQYRRCLDCRKWFEATPHVTRSDRVFCSRSCKASAHRKKIAEARRMHQSGHSAKAIAAKLETEISTVKGWLK